MDVTKIVSIALDVLLVVFLLICTLLDAKKGFLKGLTGFVGAVISVVVSIVVAPFLANLAESLFGLTSKLSEAYASGFSSVTGLDLAFNEENLQTALASLGVPAFLQSTVAQTIMKSVESLSLPEGTVIADVVFPAMASLTVSAAAGVVGFIVLATIFTIVANLLTAVFKKVRIFGALNTILGGVLGLAKGLVIAYALIAALSFIIPVYNFMENTYVIQFLRDYNLIFAILKPEEGIFQAMMDYVRMKLSGSDRVAV